MFIYENSKDQILGHHKHKMVLRCASEGVWSSYLYGDAYENGENCSKRDTGRFFRGCEGCYPLVQSLWEGSPGYPIY